MRYITLTPSCLSGGMVDTADLESAVLKSVEVQIFSWALDKQNYIGYDCLICGVSSAVERYPSKLDVVGSIPILRFPL